MRRRTRELTNMSSRHAAEWREPAQVVSQWRDAANIDPRLLEFTASRNWWHLIEELGLTLLVTREYEHLVLAVTAPGGKPRLSFFPVPHPSGLTVDRPNRSVYIASTRNPNQIFVLKPAASRLERPDIRARMPEGAPLTPVSSSYYPGCLYIHDLAVITGDLYANAVGHNAVVRLSGDSCFQRLWWPRCVEVDGAAVFNRNHIQLNSIAAGETLQDSFFSASSTDLGKLRPGHLRYPVDGRGVIFSGRTREAICTGLTRPHSARLRYPNPSSGACDHFPVNKSANEEIWVANSGYGELGYVNNGRLEVVSRMPGWTRGLCFAEGVVFVGTSRVIPKYAGYAPGVDVSGSRCAIHAISVKTGDLLGSLEWPYGNQVFAIDWIDSRVTHGFLFGAGSKKRNQEIGVFYSYLIEEENHEQ